MWVVCENTQLCARYNENEGTLVFCAAARLLRSRWENRKSERYPCQVRLRRPSLRQSFGRIENEPDSSDPRDFDGHAERERRNSLASIDDPMIVVISEIITVVKNNRVRGESLDGSDDI